MYEIYELTPCEAVRVRGVGVCTGDACVFAAVASNSINRLRDFLEIPGD